MTCRELELLLESRRTLTHEAAEHVRSCERCAFLYAEPSLPTSVPAPVVQLPESLEPVNRLPGLPVRSLGLTAAGLLVVAVVVPASGVGGLRAQDTIQLAIPLAVLGASIAAMAMIAARHMVPGCFFRFGTALPVIAATIAFLPLLPLFPIDTEARATSTGYGCLIYAVAVAGVVLLLLAWILRRGVLLQITTSRATAAVLAGLFGLVAIQLHCGVLDVFHIAMWHWTAVPLLAGAGLLWGIRTVRRTVR